jgi:hypothetical protein
MIFETVTGSFHIFLFVCKAWDGVGGGMQGDLSADAGADPAGL